MRSHSLIVLLPLVATLAAEDAPPPGDGAVPTPPPATAKPIEQDISVRTRRAPVAQVDQLPPTLAAQLTLFGGYDSDVLYRVAGEVVGSGDKEDSPTGGAEARADWRAINRPGHFLKLGVSGRDDEYSRYHDRSFTRVGGSAVWGLVLDPVTPGLAVSGNRYLVDREGVATDLRVAGTLTRLGRTHVDIVVLEANRLRYDDVPGRDGTLYAAGWRHWFLFAEGDIARRIEVGLRGGRYVATLKPEGYWTVRPGAALLWRIGSGETPGTWDLAAGGTLEWRRHGADTLGRQEAILMPAGELSADLWLPRRITAGLVLAGSLRDADTNDLDYQRWQAYLRLTMRLP